MAIKIIELWKRKEKRTKLIQMTRIMMMRDGLLFAVGVAVGVVTVSSTVFLAASLPSSMQRFNNNPMNLKYANIGVYLQHKILLPIATHLIASHRIHRIIYSTL